MNSIRLLIPLGVAGLAGCVTVPPVELPGEVRGIALAPVSSASVVVRTPRLRNKEGHLELVGSVTKVHGAKTTENTHLDISFFNAPGEMLEQQTARFSPQWLVSDRHAPNRHAADTVAIDALPAGTIRIEVRADDALRHRP